MPPSGKRRKSSCSRRGGEEEIALVALEIDRPVEMPVAAPAPGPDIVAGRQRVGAEVAGRAEQVGELDRLVAGDARHRRLAGDIAVGEAVDDRLAEALLVVEDIVGDAEGFGDAARVVDVLAGAAGALPVGRLAVVVELQRHADDVVAGPLEKAGDNGGIDAARHGDDDAGSSGRPGRSRLLRIPGTVGTSRSSCTAARA